jgi:hypothetical protein
MGCNEWRRFVMMGGLLGRVERFLECSKDGGGLEGVDLSREVKGKGKKCRGWSDIKS